MGLVRHELYLFDASENRRYLPPRDLRHVLDGLGLKKAPTLAKIPVKELSLDSLQEFVNGLAYDNGAPAEGAVFRPASGMHSFTLGKPWSAKIINQNYRD